MRGGAIDWGEVGPVIDSPPGLVRPLAVVRSSLFMEWKKRKHVG